MISMVSGSRAFAPKPSTACVFLFAPLRTSPPRSSTSTRGSAPGARLPLYAFALLLLLGGFVLSVVRLPDQAAAAQVPGARMSACPVRLRRAAGDADRPRPALLALELALERPPRAGRRLVGGDRAGPDRGRDRRLLGLPRVQYLRPDLLFSRPEARTTQSRHAAAFSDPLLGHHDPDLRRASCWRSRWASARGVDERVRPTAWLARVIES